jgi:hypothetical protein
VVGSVGGGGVTALGRVSSGVCPLKPVNSGNTSQHLLTFLDFENDRNGF